MIITHEEVEALALAAEKSAYIAGVHDLPKLQKEWTAVYTTLRALDAERGRLRREIDIMNTETPEGYVPRETLAECHKEITSLRAQLASARNAALEEALAAQPCTMADPKPGTADRAYLHGVLDFSKAIRSLMSKEG